MGELGLAADRRSSPGTSPIAIEEGGQAIVAVLEQWPDTEVAICDSDLSAYGALMECARRGMRVPEDLAIAGFGNYEIGAWSHPRLTTVDVDCYNMGRLAADKLRAVIANPAAGKDIVLTPFRVVERQSA